MCNTSPWYVLFRLWLSVWQSANFCPLIEFELKWELWQFLHYFDVKILILCAKIQIFYFLKALKLKLVIWQVFIKSPFLDKNGTFPGLRKIRSLRSQKGAKGALVKIEYSWLLNFCKKIFWYFWLLNFRILFFKGANNWYLERSQHL